jgi:hypothetical protein
LRALNISLFEDSFFLRNTILIRYGCDEERAYLSKQSDDSIRRMDRFIFP